MNKQTHIPEKAELIVQKIPCDMGIHRNPRKGVLNAPYKILEGYTSEKSILETEVFPDEFDLEETHERIFNNTDDLLDYEKPIVSLGGDHSISFPIIHSLKKKNPEMKLVWVDSHLDLKDKVDDNISHDVVVRELLENDFSIDEIFFVGTVKQDKDEKKFLEGKDANIYGPNEIQNFKNDFPECKQVYLSIDIDVLSSSLAPGTGYPDGKIDVQQVLKIIREVKPNHTDIVEVAPPLDRDDKTLKNSRKILSCLIQNIKEP